MATKQMKEEFDLVNEVMYGKKIAKNGTEETISSPTVKQLKDEDEDLELEILTGKKVKPAKVTKLSKEDQEDVDMIQDIFGNGKKKPKAESSPKEESEKKPAKKFNREEYFGL
jgi:hypothetical protein